MRILFVFIVAIILASCQEKKTQIIEPRMKYTDLQNAELALNQMRQFDLDGNGKNDIRFNIYNVGDPLENLTKIQFRANSLIEAYFPMDADDIVAPLEAGSKISTHNSAEYNWHQVSSFVLAQKNIGASQPPYWTGAWKDANHKYLPIQLNRRGQRYNGWVELSFDINNEKVILHRAAISSVGNMDILAGE